MLLQKRGDRVLNSYLNGCLRNAEEKIVANFYYFSLDRHFCKPVVRFAKGEKKKSKIMLNFFRKLKICDYPVYLMYTILVLIKGQWEPSSF